MPRVCWESSCTSLETTICEYLLIFQFSHGVVLLNMLLGGVCDCCCFVSMEIAM